MKLEQVTESTGRRNNLLADISWKLVRMAEDRAANNAAETRSALSGDAIEREVQNLIKELGPYIESDLLVLRSR